MSDGPAWERQPWDTDKSYANFHTYYLSQEASIRSLAEAYRRYRRAQGYKKVEVAPPGVWYKWSYGQDNDGKNPPDSVWTDALSWKKRAEAYDDFLYQQEQAKWINRRLAIREDEWTIGDKLVIRANEMLKALLFERTVDTANGVTILKPANWTESDIGKTFDLALKMQRRATGMEEGKIGVVVDWKRQLAEAGIDASELFEKTVNALVNEVASQ